MTPGQYSSLQKELSSIVCKYTVVDSMRPDVAELVKSPDNLGLFRDVFGNYISMIKMRSQAFEDGKVTLYDKALLILTANGNNLHNLGAIELFLDEILGVKKDGRARDVEAILEKNIAVRSMLQRAQATDCSDGNFDKEVKHEDVEGMTEMPANKKPKRELESPAEKKESSRTLGDSDSAISKMLDTLERAKKEFHAVDEKERGAKYLAAKFLRDTAENILAYFRENGLQRHELVPHIKSAYWLGYKKTLAATGGRARPFEMSSDQYRYRERQLRDTRPNFGRADCYRPRERNASPADRARARYSRRG
ncbi:hypothetical protein CPC735_058980 [Coccidioides posadasii C735 delta SOWgp]|uniref:Uncharacterized protein n=1 Tax=Coccidioides posadasii (strain C735) TaxID=222929 RepID=C5PEK8_COCP7|nr:hypothetical protein CPC735_058980 [Coccidioides posadasii C735 delta SOWgp]EER24528.1 hypothetical protein CPC735_058980 [Coccidioides posadasii C735 delta SOWgp]|eukprot:XP_003066673.1 hypothetical protein CPC735_058980 [Coccidioides posadasii C735 delta SOWgp]